jgi:hypothetical protein
LCGRRAYPRSDAINPDAAQQPGRQNPAMRYFPPRGSLLVTVTALLHPVSLHVPIQPPDSKLLSPRPRGSAAAAPVGTRRRARSAATCAQPGSLRATARPSTSHRRSQGTRPSLHSRQQSVLSVSQTLHVNASAVASSQRTLRHSTFISLRPLSKASQYQSTVHPALYRAPPYLVRPKSTNRPCAKTAKSQIMIQGACRPYRHAHPAPTEKKEQNTAE